MSSTLSLHLILQNSAGRGVDGGDLPRKSPADISTLPPSRVTPTLVRSEPAASATVAAPVPNAQLDDANPVAKEETRRLTLLSVDMARCTHRHRLRLARRRSSRAHRAERRHHFHARHGPLSARGGLSALGPPVGSRQHFSAPDLGGDAVRRRRRTLRLRPRKTLSFMTSACATRLGSVNSTYAYLRTPN